MPRYSVTFFNRRLPVPPAPPEPPDDLVGLTAVPTGTNNLDVLLSWSAATGADGYLVESSTDNATWSEIADTTDTDYTDTSPSHGAVTLYYRVRAYNDGGESANITATQKGRWVGAPFVSGLNEGSGNRSTQVSGLTLTDNNTVLGTIGKLSNAALFVAPNNEYLSVSDNAIFHFGTGDFTLGAWIHPTSSAADYAHIITKDTGGAREWVWYIARTGGSFQHEFYLFDSGNSIAASINVGSQAYDDTYRVLFMRDGSDLKMYINGSLAATNAISGTPRAGTATGVRFGIDNATNPITAYDGWMDEIILIRRAWSDDEIDEDFNSNAGVEYPD